MKNALLSLLLLAAATSSTLSANAAPLPKTNIVLKSAISVDPLNNTVKLPLHRGTSHGVPVWYIVTDSSDKSDAARRGVVYSAILANVGDAERVTRKGDELLFAAAPDFSNRRVFAPGATGFPPAKAQPGATAGYAYSPFIQIDGAGPVLNAPIVAVGNGPYDVTTHTNTAPRVLAIDTQKRTVTLLLVHGFANGREVLYISTEASDPGAATIERATYVPGLANAAGKIAILVFVNGQQQGLAYTSLQGNSNLDATLANASTLRASRNILTAFPTGATAAAYSPLWDVNVAVWSARSVAAHENVVEKSAGAVYALASSSKITGPGGKAFGPVGIVVNCPVVAYIDGAP